MMPAYDIVIKNGRVFDPGSNIDRKLDVAIANGKIAELAEFIDPINATRSINAQSLYIFPGFIDLHAHVFIPDFGLGNDTDATCFESGVTTLADAGSTGTATFSLMKEYLLPNLEVTFKAFLNISSVGLIDLNVDGSRYLEFHDGKRTVDTVLAHSEIIAGIKTRVCRHSADETGMIPLGIAKYVAKQAGELPVMVHVSDSITPLGAILNKLEEGDIVSHFLHGHGQGLLDKKGRICKEAWEARRRGVIFDLAHGAQYFNCVVTRTAIEQGFLPDILSSGLSRVGRTGTAKNLAHILSKFLNIGLSLSEVIHSCTVAPASLLKLPAGYGQICVGGPADIVVCSLEEGEFTFEDTDNTTFAGSKRLLPRFTIKSGRVVWGQSS